MAYIPLPYEFFQAFKLLVHTLFVQDTPVLLQHLRAHFGVFLLRDSIFDIGSFETVKRPNYAIDLSK